MEGITMPIANISICMLLFFQISPHCRSCLGCARVRSVFRVNWWTVVFKDGRRWRCEVQPRTLCKRGYAQGRYAGRWKYDFRV